jgi:hypothetical protein
MLHVIVVAFATFLNPATGEAPQARAVTSGPLACAQVINDNHVIELESGTYYMTEAHCQGYYADDKGNVYKEQK